MAVLDPLPSKQWDAQKARHLLNRAGFGIPHSGVSYLAGLSPKKAVNFFVDYEDVADPFDPPDFLVDPLSPREIRQKTFGTNNDDPKLALKEYRRRERLAVQSLKAWWLRRMQTTKRPLQEKLTLFWHGHFATSAQKVRSSWHTYELNDLFRKNATGNFKALTTAVGQSPSMLRYLDNAQNYKGRPNENWARELMELFTMGKNTYTEPDIKNSARAWTGWTTDYLQFRFNEQTHDFGTKTFLGQTGNFDGWDILDIIFQQPATAEHISGKLWKFFVAEQIDPIAVSELANTIRSHNYDLKPALKQMFLCQEFYSPQVMGTQIKSPVQFALQLGADFDLPTPPYDRMARLTARLGQDLFFPPNVKGWDGNSAWINTNTLLIRYNTPLMLAHVRVAAHAEAGEQPSMAMETETYGRLGMNRRERIRELLQHLPEEKRLDTLEQLFYATPGERRRILRTLAKDSFLSAPWRAHALLDDLYFTNAGQCVDALAARFLSVPLSAPQKAVLLEALGAKDNPSTPLVAADVPDAKLTGALHLLFSAAEYQLC